MMFTQCRGCGELFSISVDDLVSSAARVRCSACGTIFNALETLSDYRPKEDTNLLLHDSDNPPPLLTHESKQSIIPDELTHDKLEKIQIKFNPEDEVQEAIIPEMSFGRDARKKPSKLWVLLVFMLFGLGLWQVTEGVKQGSVILPDHAISEKICSTIHCYRPQDQNNFDNIALVSRSIRKHPGHDNALTISIGMINGDDEVHDFPALQIKMSNLQGETVAMRRFLPAEYTDPDSIERGMLSNTLIPVTLDFQSPGQSAVTFEVSFSPTYGAI